jgi:hypothetical protein
VSRCFRGSSCLNDVKATSRKAYIPSAGLAMAVLTPVCRKKVVHVVWASRSTTYIPARCTLVHDVCYGALLFTPVQAYSMQCCVGLSQPLARFGCCFQSVVRGLHRPCGVWPERSPLLSNAHSYVLLLHRQSTPWKALWYSRALLDM